MDVYSPHVKVIHVLQSPIRATAINTSLKLPSALGQWLALPIAFTPAIVF
ncbi:hypothetical protein K443DRAFT_12121 [Laccaria amethystina LaAM-08-1]|uniref:Uncharacterized protein n=1 Tax=Laccaria amethystina LaAM-08-1 TaxID=1095629 RepID=A0A0C9WJC0_9AGAR|nr:hypothetical protein K443DRAFT_12121 [Laccaria amethystina LaAM-08-1]